MARLAHGRGLLIWTMFLFISGIFMLLVSSRGVVPLAADAYFRLSHDERTDYWRTRIDSDGGPDVYRELIELVAPLETPARHLNAHLFGTALYDTVGLPGAVTCDGRFIYGCFHAFMIRAVEMEGLGISQELHGICASTLGDTAEQCQHGIGHGLLGAIGYGIEDLKEALSICDALQPDFKGTGGCRGGIFMEYGMRGMLDITESERRAFVDAEALEPCTDLPDRWLSSCAFWQPTWWTEADPGRTDRESLANIMGERCRQMPGGREAYLSCISGIGNRAQFLTDEDPLRVAHICALVSDDPDIRFHCQVRSAMRFTTYHPLEFSLDACKGLPAQKVSACRETATALSADRRADQERFEAQ